MAYETSSNVNAYGGLLIGPDASDIWVISLREATRFAKSGLMDRSRSYMAL